MISVRFLRGDRAGLRWYRAGEVAGIPDGEARRLVAQGAVELVEPPKAAPSSPVVTAPAASNVETRQTKPIKSKNLWRR